jgi:hypothetical protein
VFEAQQAFRYNPDVSPEADRPNGRRAIAVAIACRPELPMPSTEPTPQPPGAPQPGWRSRSLAAGGLLVVLALVAGLNAAHMRHNPLPKLTNHSSAQLVPKIMALTLGYDLWPPGPDEHERLITNSHFYPLPQRLPGREPGPADTLRELRKGGRLHQLVGPCSQPFSVCMPHSMALPALLASALPGRLLLVNLVPTAWLLVLLAAVFGVGRELGGRWVGLSAAAVAAGYPGLFGHARFMEGYVPAAALSVAMIWCLLRSKGLTRPLPLLGFCVMAWTALRNGEGFSEGLGVGLAVSGPFAWVLVQGIWRDAHRRRVPWRSLLGLAAVLLFLWATTDVFWVRGSMRHVSSGFSDAAVAAGSSPGAPMAWLHPYVPRWAYLILIWSDYLLPLMTLWLLLALPCFLLWRRGHRVFVLLWLLIPFTAYTLQLRKSMWYPLPVLPPLAVITAAGLGALPKTWPRRIAITLAGTSGLVQLCVLSVGLDRELLPRDSWLRAPLPLGVVNVRGYDLTTQGDPQRQRLAALGTRLLEQADLDLPPSDRLRYIGVLSPWGAPPTAAEDLAYQIGISRPDLVVIPLAQRFYVEQAQFAGLEPADFAYLLQLDGVDPVPCCTLRSVPAPNMAPDAPLRSFLARLEAAAGPPVDGWAELIRMPAATR